MGSPTAPLELTLCELERLSQCHSHFEGLYLVKKPIWAIILVTINH